MIRDLTWWIVLLLLTLFQGSMLSSFIMSSLFASCRYYFTSHSTFCSLTFPNVLQPGHLGHCLPRVHMLLLPVHSGRRGVLKLRLRPPIQLCPSRCKAHRYRVLTVHRCGCSWGGGLQVRVSILNTQGLQIGADVTLASFTLEFKKCLLGRRLGRTRVDSVSWVGWV